MSNKVDIKDSLKMIKGFVIPTRPAVLLELSKLQNTFVPNPLEVTALILEDMAVAATILQTANQILAGHNRKVESIDRAMVLLGQEKLRSIIQELFMSASVTGKDSLLQKIRSQGVRMARIMAWLAQEMAILSPLCQSSGLPLVATDEAYVAGLFHDCGQMVLARRFPDYPDLLATYAQQSATLEAVEIDRYHTSHALLGALLLDSWQLPKSLAQIVDAHHHLETFASGKPVAERKYAVIHALLFLAQWFGGELLDWEWEPEQDYFYRFFAVEADQVRQLQQQAHKLFPKPTPK